MNKKKIPALVLAALLVVLDQAIKNRALSLLRPVSSVEVIPGLFSLTWVENRGAAFGIFQGNTVALSIVTGAVMIVLLALLLSGRAKGALSLCSLTLILAGGLGNLIDRVFRGYVIDYLDFSALFGFPVFNLADCCVVVGTILLVTVIVRMEIQEKQSRDTENEHV